LLIFVITFHFDGYVAGKVRAPCAGIRYGKTFGAVGAPGTDEAILHSAHTNLLLCGFLRRAGLRELIDDLIFTHHAEIPSGNTLKVALVVLESINLSDKFHIITLDDIKAALNFLLFPAKVVNAKQPPVPEDGEIEDKGNCQQGNYV
jgi:hypothetical protein